MYLYIQNQLMANRQEEYARNFNESQIRQWTESQIILEMRRRNFDFASPIDPFSRGHFWAQWGIFGPAGIPNKGGPHCLG